MSILLSFFYIFFRFNNQCKYTHFFQNPIFFLHIDLNWFDYQSYVAISILIFGVMELLIYTNYTYIIIVSASYHRPINSYPTPTMVGVDTDMIRC